MLENLKRQFVEPSDEFTPIPFWFWNDELSQEEIVRQMNDFYAKGVAGVVIHPRMGLPRALPYLSEAFMDLVQVAVEEAARLGMLVILYDEGMYPSGAANGLVVQHNPELASRGLRVDEYKCSTGHMEQLVFELSPGETIISTQAVCKISDTDIQADKTVVLEADGSRVQFTPPSEGEWSVLVFIETFSEGHIRGVHSGQDDGELEAPRSADLLSEEAVQLFISLTHERYYSKLKAYFGKTIIAMFTDEPDLLGRGHKKGLKPWTKDFLGEVLSSGNVETDLPMLWFNAESQNTQRARATYDRTVRHRLSQVYYKQLYDWCEQRGIALTGHPAASDDIGLLAYFHIPGQDVVWRYIAPEEGKSLTGVHSTLGKCSSDAARHRGRRRNLNECFGVCGKESGWALRADEMKWYLDWLFIRGVNLISPHAFYYSIRDERRDERPPDVGPHNIWWSEYSRFSTYIKRMCWLMTDSLNVTEVAVLAQAAYLPWKSVKPLYEHQVEFNYLEEELLRSSCRFEDGTILIAGQQYRAVVVEDGRIFEPETLQLLRLFIQQGGTVIEWDEDGIGMEDIGQQLARSAEDIPLLLERSLGRDARLTPACPSLRMSHVIRENVHFYTVVNEGEDMYEGSLQVCVNGRVEIWHPWAGTMEETPSCRLEDGLEIHFRIQRRECVLIVVDPQQPQQEATVEVIPLYRLVETIDLSRGWHLQDVPLAVRNDIADLCSWAEWDEMKHFSGTLTYEKSFHINNPEQYDHIELDLGEAHELVRVWINDKEVGLQMWAPYVLTLRDPLRSGGNGLRISVTNSLANRYDQLSLPSGLIGPVRLLCYKAEY